MKAGEDVAGNTGTATTVTAHEAGQDGPIGQSTPWSDGPDSGETSSALLSRLSTEICGTRCPVLLSLRSDSCPRAWDPGRALSDGVVFV